MVNNEVFVGANAQVGLCPELDLFFNSVDVDATGLIYEHDLSASLVKLIPNLYIGCTVKIDGLTSNDATSYRTITANTATTITIDSPAVDSTGANLAGSDNVGDLTILSFGAPAYGKVKSSTGTILSDNWVGLVNTFTPPNVEVEMKQLNLAAAGGRNLDYQYKGAETVSGGSLDLSLNNGSWLYYALGKISSIAGGSTAQNADHSNSLNGFGYHLSNKQIVRVIGQNIYPEIASSNVFLGHTNINYSTGGSWTYTFAEADDDVLPSFALDVAYRKSNQSNTSVVDSNTPNENLYSVIYTGCQVNSLTLNFEEGQELKSSVELVTRRAFDAPDGYLPLRGQVGLAGLDDSSNDAGGVGNYSTTLADNYPFLFSDGLIKLFGQTMARVKGGSLTISNNLTPQRFIGNYNRQITSAHLPGQRTYEVTLTMLITDTKLWDEMRSENESTGVLQLKFEKSGGEKIDIQLSDYTINSVTIPFPEDKGAIEVEVAATARTLTSATYKGKWAIQTLGGTATGN